MKHLILYTLAALITGLAMPSAAHADFKVHFKPYSHMRHGHFHHHHHHHHHVS